MKKEQKFYLIKVQYLGFRYHGWAPQPGVKTVQGMIEKTLNFIYQGIKFKVLGAGRTDAMVSANGAYFELFMNEEIDLQSFLPLFNLNLPQDIKALSIREVSSQFNIIQSVKQKEYHYNFSFGEKTNPLSSPFMIAILENLNINAMMEAAKAFEGQHDFIQYCYKPVENINTIRTVDSCSIQQKNNTNSNFFPSESFVLQIKGRGFMRKQIRLIMGALILIGKGEVTLNQIEKSLQGNYEFEQYVAPASGLILEEIEFNDL